MPPTSTAQFRLYLKANSNMKLSTDVAVACVLYEGIQRFSVLSDFGKESIIAVAKKCMKAISEIDKDLLANIEAELEIPHTVILTKSVVPLTVAVNAAKYNISTGKVPVLNGILWFVLASFKIKYQAYCEPKKQDKPATPVIKDANNETKVIRWAPQFLDCKTRTFGVKIPLAYKL